MELYTEGDLVTRTVRDVFSTDVDRIVVDNKEVAKRVKEVIKIANPRTRNKVELYEEPVPLFPQVRHRARNRADVQPARSAAQRRFAGDRQHRSVVAIDVNSGKFREHATPKRPPSKPTWKPPTKFPASFGCAIWAA
jgi:ribonuclease E